MLSLCANVFDDIVANSSADIVSLCAQKYLHIDTSRITDVMTRTTLTTYLISTKPINKACEVISSSCVVSTRTVRALESDTVTPLKCLPRESRVAQVDFWNRD